MCGILAIYSFDGQTDENALIKGIKSLWHRGPDNQNIWLNEHQTVGLAHARLSIIDLHTGQQPISNQAENCHLIANGEFYDYEHIRSQLQKQGHFFKTASDSEIALHLYKQYGVNGLKQLRGEFAFCIWDEVNQQLFAARDRFGINPLYYAEYQGKLYIASEIKALLAAGIPAKWDKNSYLSRGFLYRSESLFAGIKQVPPGHYLIANSSGFTISKYWDFNYPAEGSELALTESEAIEQLREKLLDSVQTRLRADVPVGVYLSGGVDSCAVLGMASQLTNNRVDSFTLSFDVDEYDEGNIARNTANFVGSNHHEIKITQTEIADNFVDSIYFSENVCMNPHGVAKYLLSKYVRDLGFRVVLTGEGADEVFAGYASFKQDYANYTQVLASDLDAANKISSGIHFANNIEEYLPIKGILGHIPAWVPPLANINQELSELFVERDNNFDVLVGLEIFLNSLNVDELNQINPVHKSMYTLSKSLLPNYVLMTLGDRMEMAHSLEGRIPFLDHKVVEFVTQLPIEYKIKNMQEKYILREAVKPYITEEVYKRQKHPFFAPPSVLNPKAKFYQLVQDTLRGQALKDVPFFEHTKVINFLNKLDNLPQEKWATTEAILMEIMSLVSLQHHFKLAE
ncbi:asparagine synthase (glutamine-hydrolyzing) [Catenovulum agarivorans]|uniref:asparagine synthase (glutamine-hydrolyzing) n=1 Tax=Catenovulum agarivorans TaxID=1172192 RepID=UPI0002E2FD30|nr:asparagine synthase (glutamine-hydrolyzing) [Catenovulum agarivorans]